MINLPIEPEAGRADRVVQDGKCFVILPEIAVFRTDDLATQRGLEQILYNRNPSAQLANGGLNRIRPISVRNPRTLVYEDAAVRYLQQMGLL